MNPQTEYEIDTAIARFGFGDEEQCPATREAVEEEEYGPGDGCPLCNRPAEAHSSEVTP